MKVYITRRNADMTEGRGPMIMDKVFDTYEKAEIYINSQPGVMGRKGNWTSGKDGSDWDIKEATVETDVSMYLPKRESDFDKSRKWRYITGMVEIEWEDDEVNSTGIIGRDRKGSQWIACDNWMFGSTALADMLKHIKNIKKL